MSPARTLGTTRRDLQFRFNVSKDEYRWLNLLALEQGITPTTWLRVQIRAEAAKRNLPSERVRRGRK